MSERVDAAVSAYFGGFHHIPDRWGMEQALAAAADQVMFSEEAIERAAEKLGIGYPKAVVRAVVAALRGEA